MNQNNITLAKAAAYFQNEATSNGIAADMQRLKVKGAERDATDWNVIVHPGHAFDKTWMEANIKAGFSQKKMLEWACKYYGLILNLIVDFPENTIVICEEKEVGLDIMKYHNKIVHTTGGSGRLLAPDLVTFFEMTSGINQKDTHRIHGSIWGRSPERFSSQLHIASQFDGYTGRHRSGYIGARSDNEEEGEMLRSIRNSGSMENGQITVGVQHNTALYDGLSKDIFLDEKSIIIPSPQEVKEALES